MLCHGEQGQRDQIGLGGMVMTFLVAMSATWLVLTVAQHHVLTEYARDNTRGRAPGHATPPSADRIPLVDFLLLQHESASAGNSAKRARRHLLRGSSAHDLFHAYDRNGSRALDRDEFGEAVLGIARQAGGDERLYKPSLIDLMFTGHDTDQSGDISLAEMRAGGSLRTSWDGRPEAKAWSKVGSVTLNSTTAAQRCIYHVHGFTHSGTGVLRQVLHKLAAPLASKQTLKTCCEHEGQYAQVLCACARVRSFVFARCLLPGRVVSVQCLVSLVALPGMVGLVALEGLLGLSFPFYPF